MLKSIIEFRDEHCKCEKITTWMAGEEGFVHVPDIPVPRTAFKLASDTGFDDIVTKVINGQEHFIIVESKGNSAALKYINGGIKQMSEEWVKDVIARMRNASAEHIALADRLDAALTAGRMEGRIGWVQLVGEGVGSTRMTYRYYGPGVPAPVKALYRKASKW